MQVNDITCLQCMVRIYSQDNYVLFFNVRMLFACGRTRFQPFFMATGYIVKHMHIHAERILLISNVCWLWQITQFLIPWLKHSISAFHGSLNDEATDFHINCLTKIWLWQGPALGKLWGWNYIWKTLMSYICEQIAKFSFCVGCRRLYSRPINFDSYREKGENKFNKTSRNWISLMQCRDVLDTLNTYGLVSLILTSWTHRRQFGLGFKRRRFSSYRRRQEKVIVIDFVTDSFTDWLF